MIRTKFLKSENIPVLPDSRLKYYKAGFGDVFPESVTSKKGKKKELKPIDRWGSPQRRRAGAQKGAEDAYSAPITREIDRIKDCLTRMTEKDEGVPTIVQHESEPLPEEKVDESLVSLKSTVTTTDLKTATERGGDPFYNRGLHKSIGQDGEEDGLEVEFLICIPVKTPVRCLDAVEESRGNELECPGHNDVGLQSVQVADQEQTLAKKETYTVFPGGIKERLIGVSRRTLGRRESSSSRVITDLARMSSECPENSKRSFLFLRPCRRAQSLNFTKRTVAEESKGNYLVLGNSWSKRMTKESRKCLSEKRIETSKRDLWPKGPIQVRKAESARGRLACRMMESRDLTNGNYSSVEEKLGHLLNNRPRRLPPLQKK